MIDLLAEKWCFPCSVCWKFLKISLLIFWYSFVEFWIFIWWAARSRVNFSTQKKMKVQNGDIYAAACRKMKFFFSCLLVVVWVKLIDILIYFLWILAMYLLSRRPKCQKIWHVFVWRNVLLVEQLAEKWLFSCSVCCYLFEISMLIFWYS